MVLIARGGLCSVWLLPRVQLEWFRSCLTEVWMRIIVTTLAGVLYTMQVSTTLLSNHINWPGEIKFLENSTFLVKVHFLISYQIESSLGWIKKTNNISAFEGHSIIVKLLGNAGAELDMVDCDGENQIFLYWNNFHWNIFGGNNFLNCISQVRLDCTWHVVRDTMMWWFNFSELELMSTLSTSR